MTGMEHAIEQAARTLFLSDRGDTLPAGFPERQWDEGHAVRDDYLRRARALAEAGLLAPEREPTVPASQLRAFARLCVYWGDMTPAAARMLDRIIDGDGRAEK